MKQKQYSPYLKNTRTGAPYSEDHTKLNNAVDDLIVDDIDANIAACTFKYKQIF